MIQRYNIHTGEKCCTGVTGCGQCHTVRKGAVGETGYSQAAKESVHHPKHYTSHPSGIECIEITEHMNFNIGNAIKYLWRNGKKTPFMKDQLKDLRKAIWYIEREISRCSPSAPEIHCAGEAGAGGESGCKDTLKFSDVA